MTGEVATARVQGVSGARRVWVRVYTSCLYP